MCALVSPIFKASWFKSWVSHFLMDFDFNDHPRVVLINQTPFVGSWLHAVEHSNPTSSSSCITNSTYFKLGSHSRPMMQLQILRALEHGWLWLLYHIVTYRCILFHPFLIACAEQTQSILVLCWPLCLSNLPLRKNSDKKLVGWEKGEKKNIPTIISNHLLSVLLKFYYLNSMQ